MANKPLIKIAGELREMTDEEYEIHLQDMENFAKFAREKAEAQAAKSALLEKLGITQEEAKLLLS